MEVNVFASIYASILIILPSPESHNSVLEEKSPLLLSYQKGGKANLEKGEVERLRFSLLSLISSFD